MTAHEAILAKIQQLPDTLVQEVNDFVDFLLLRQNAERWELLNYLAETQELAESDMSDYLANLEDYEDRLARGEIQW